MAKYRDLEDMIEILNLVIARQKSEEDFFRRSGDASTNEVAKALFSEIAEDLRTYRESLEKRQQKIVDALLSLKPGQKTAAKHEIEEVSALQDPVCKMLIDKSKMDISAIYQGKKYHFCSKDCKEAFELAPEKYVKNDLPDSNLR